MCRMNLNHPETILTLTAAEHSVRNAPRRSARVSHRPRKAAPPSKNSPKNAAGRSRYLPAAVRREVWRRDCGRCRFLDHKSPTNARRRCGETRDVEFHHKIPFGKGGKHEPGNLAVLSPTTLPGSQSIPSRPRLRPHFHAGQAWCVRARGPGRRMTVRYRKSPESAKTTPP